MRVLNLFSVVSTITFPSHMTALPLMFTDVFVNFLLLFEAASLMKFGHEFVMMFGAASLLICGTVTLGTAGIDRWITLAAFSLTVEMTSLIFPKIVLVVFFKMSTTAFFLWMKTVLKMSKAVFYWILRAAGINLYWLLKVIPCWLLKTVWLLLKTVWRAAIMWTVKGLVHTPFETILMMAIGAMMIKAAAVANPSLLMALDRKFWAILWLIMENAWTVTLGVVILVLLF